MALSLTELDRPEGFERLVLAEDADAGLRALICLHSTVLGPAAGGCRMWPYGSDADAIHDVTRLARGMTYKNAMAGLDLGGGKSVIIGDARRDKTPAMMRAFGRAVQSLGGRYWTAEDVGISTEDMAHAAEETRFAVGLSGASGDPSPWTAEGVFRCLKVGAAHVFGLHDLQGCSVLVQGLGHVGMSLADKLHGAGAKLIVTDIHADALSEAEARFGATVIAPDQVFDQTMDIFAPCALGGVLDADSVGRMQARLVCGAANNQLATDDIADLLVERGITYLPDYVVNAGGIISVASEIHGKPDGWRLERLTAIAGRVDEMLTRARAEGQTTTRIADQMVEAMLRA
ncbi:Glu/Leu/Phe/Val dehydrogenase dimerization domain-containing protein [Paracoccus sp. 1_MG-2023]|uniref:Glu/Leu/Phe/Val dehydrogenase dimerization domain-containing protein n=1 Tax=unclassified Paracoccus (in: a-proteobacteria) TaxID=2688777 RepID=UPI001C098C1B|nr:MULTISPECIES: Glu/Leu/Phe/Val dehydrogenase dimerization domain-containing protein [unclassified Paracoccus (in: a-proteobacteria)]MBU2958520.1 amino acid dehydrogenase [Paracoccus sp. C2R09]MDO6668495.1 Glu/Leu/Phe/Val dehydrogenase dimerization domain-containing protein [Paracoccus sp. 1_MG-2023]